MLIYLGSDHAGYELKAHLVRHLSRQGHHTVDLGPARYQGDDDYPPYILQTALQVTESPGSLGIVIGGSGNGEAIAANKVCGIRAALVWDEQTARLAREHNDANVLSLGARMHSLARATELADIFVRTPFSGECRHTHRIAMIRAYERTGRTPPFSDCALNGAALSRSAARQ